MLSILETVNNTVESLVNIIHPYSIDLQIREETVNSWEDRRIEKLFQKRNPDEDKFENVWNLIKDKTYYIRVFLYDEKRNSIYLTNNVKIKVAHQNIIFMP